VPIDPKVERQRIRRDLLAQCQALLTEPYGRTVRAGGGSARFIRAGCEPNG
jgi:hypothetical protein